MADMVNGVLYLGFNQDQGCFCCGTTNGFRVFSTDPVSEHSRQVFEDGGLGHVEMLFRCNYVAVVGGGPNPKFPTNQVHIWDDLKRKFIITMEFSEEVRAVRLRRDRIAVVLENEIRLFTFTQNPQPLQVFSTAPNKKADLSFPEKKPVEIEAHESSLSYLVMNLQGTLLASSSEKGTVVRVFDTHTGQLLQEFRRGSAHASIYCINFNADSTLLCVSSDHGTIHVFAMNQMDPTKHSSLSSSLLPRYFSSKWSFSKFQTPPARGFSICAFGSEQNTVIVICSDGSFFKFSFTTKGECTREAYGQFLHGLDTD